MKSLETHDDIIKRTESEKPFLSSCRTNIFRKIFFVCIIVIEISTLVLLIFFELNLKSTSEFCFTYSLTKNDD